MRMIDVPTNKQHINTKYVHITQVYMFIDKLQQHFASNEIYVIQLT